MSIESKVMTGVSSIVDFMKDQVASTLMEAKSRKMIDIDEVTLEKINNLVRGSIEASFIRSSDEIINVVRNAKK